MRKCWWGSLIFVEIPTLTLTCWDVWASFRLIGWGWAMLKWELLCLEAALQLPAIKSFCFGHCSRRGITANDNKRFVGSFQRAPFEPRIPIMWARCMGAQQQSTTSRSQGADEFPEVHRRKEEAPVAQVHCDPAAQRFSNTAVALSPGLCFSGWMLRYSKVRSTYGYIGSPKKNVASEPIIHNLWVNNPNQYPVCPLVGFLLVHM